MIVRYINVYLLLLLLLLLCAFNFIMPVQNFGRPTLGKFQGEKRAKFGPISDDFKVRRRTSPKGMKIFKISQILDLRRFLSR